MRIIKGETESFDQYQVLVVTDLHKPWYTPKGAWPNSKIETELKFVLEADDANGLVVRQLTTENNEPIFSNGAEEIFLSNECKLLMLTPTVAENFIKAGFKPKTVTVYEKCLKIINRNPTVAISMAIQESLETSEIEHVKV